MNAEDKLGLTSLQILLAKLLDLAFIQNKPQEQRPARVGTETSQGRNRYQLG